MLVWMICVTSLRGTSKTCLLKMKLLTGFRFIFRSFHYFLSLLFRAFAIEATCHSADRVTTFSNVNRVLKEDGLFAGYDWVLIMNRFDINLLC